MLITNKNRINETLKNPEKRLFGYVFAFSATFLVLLTYFSLLFHFLVVLLQQRRISW